MQILTHRKHPDGSYLLAVWTDETKTLDDGTPDPASVREFEYGPPPQGVTQKDYEAMQLRETKLLLEAETASAGTKLASEGTQL